MKLKIFIVSVLLLRTAAVFAQMVGVLDDDSRIVRDTMPNGLVYYLVNNPTVEGYADFTFVQKIGIAMEDSASRGMTYLMECMALTETLNFPDGAIFTFIDDMGLDRTDGLVIDGGDYYTIYRFSDVPVKKNESVVDSMLLAMFNISSALMVDDRSVERGKNFFHNVFAGSETLDQRVRDSVARYYFAGTSLAPVPQKELFGLVDSYTTEDVRRFYRTRCRPDLQAIVIAGDIDTAAVSSKIRALFQVIPRASDPLPEFPDSLLETSGGQYFYFRDKEADCARVTFDYIIEPVDVQLRNTAVPFIYDYLSSLGVDLMRRRLADAIDSAPFYVRSYDVRVEPFLNRKSFRITVDCAPEDYVQAYEYILSEVERLLSYGIPAREFERCRNEFFFHLNDTYERRSLLDNRYYTDLCVSNFSDGYVMAGVEFSKAYIEAAGPAIDSSTLYSFMASLFSDPDRRTVTCSAPVPTGGLEYFRVDPGPVGMDTVLYAATRTLMESRRIPEQKVVNASTGVTSRRLPNGATMAYRYMDVEPGWVHFEAVARGGVSLADRNLSLLRSYAGDVARLSVNGGLNAFELDRLLDVFHMELGREISVSERKITGRFPVEEMEQFMQLASMYFDGSEPDEETFDKYRKMVSGCAPYSRNSPENLFHMLHMRDVRSGYGVETGAPDIAGLDYLEALEFVNTLFSNAADFTFIFVGDFNEQKLLSTAYDIIGGLPGRRSVQRRSENSRFFIASYDDEEVVRIPMEFPRRLNSCKLTIPSDLNMEDRVLSEVTAKIIEREVIRRLSLRGILADAQRRFYRYPEEVLTIDFHFTTYEEVPDMGGMFADIVEDLAYRGVSDNEVDAVRRNLLLIDDLQERVDFEYWKRILRSRYIDRKDFYTRRESAMEALTGDQVREELYRVLDEGRISLLSVAPEE